VKRHNEIYEIKLDEISNKVEGKKRELKVLKAEIKKAADLIHRHSLEKMHKQNKNL